ncbi:O-antigen ligase family protein [Anoxynatronum sibiricum]|uniref:O-antigen ligase family protein n=2 Tax=Anoxynatronum sibiricum TaxID=210623 RepID=A0ABU9VU01_9CLOT
MIEKNTMALPDLLWVGGLSTMALLAAVMMAAQSPYMIVMIPGALLLAALLLSSDTLCLAAVIPVLPLSASTLFTAQLLPVPGARINNILLLLLLLGFLLNRKPDFRELRPAAVFYAGSLLLLTAAIFRTGHVAGFAREFWQESYSPVKFFLSHGLIPLLTSIPFLMIAGSIRQGKEIRRVLFYLALSMSLFSGVIVGTWVLKVPPGADFSTVRDIIGLETLGMHGNNLADFIIVGFPLMLAMALVPRGKYRRWFYVAAALSLVAATLIYSRTAYAMILLSIAAIVMLTRQYRLILPVVVLVVLVAVAMPGVTERALTGLEGGERNVITAGRTDEIWRPVMREWRQRTATHPWQTLAGYGRYGIMDFQTFRNGRMLRVTHSHNMFLDTLVDTGIIGLAFYLGFLGYVLTGLLRAFYRRRRSGSIEELHVAAGLLTSLGCFLGRGLTDSFLLPQLTNAYFYMVMALAFVIIGQEKKQRFLESTARGEVGKSPKATTATMTNRGWEQPPASLEGEGVEWA